MKITKSQLRKMISKEKQKLNEMARGPADGYGGYEYREDVAQFNDAHSALVTPLGHASNSADVGSDLFHVLIDIFREASAKGMSKSSIVAAASDAARDFDY